MMRESRDRRVLGEIVCDALRACDAAGVVEDAVSITGRRLLIMGRPISLVSAGRLLVLAYGKAAAAMLRGLLARIREAGGTRAGVVRRGRAGLTLPVVGSSG
jgi:glycerate-2-kinase